MNKQIIKLVKKGRLRWKKHALERMLERDIFREDVIHVLLHGELIEEYPDDNPFPSGLMLGFTNNNPLHVVVAVDSSSAWCYLITVYRPDSNHFEDDFKTRKL